MRVCPTKKITPGEALAARKDEIQNHKWTMKHFASETDHPRDSPEGQSYMKAKAVVDQYEKEVLHVRTMFEEQQIRKTYLRSMGMPCAPCLVL